MKGGFNNPPNSPTPAAPPVGWPASMKGGFNNPPNPEFIQQCPPHWRASMKGGFNNPPNLAVRTLSVSCGNLLQ